jgi:hypothetical protein
VTFAPIAVTDAGAVPVEYEVPETPEIAGAVKESVPSVLAVPPLSVGTVVATIMNAM